MLQKRHMASEEEPLQNPSPQKIQKLDPEIQELPQKYLADSQKIRGIWYLNKP